MTERGINYATLSFDDGSPHDWEVARRLVDRGLVATFYFSKTNAKNLTMDEDEMVRFAKAFPQMEVGQHTYSHQLLTRIPYLDAHAEIIQGYYWHKETFGNPPTAFCYPRGYYTPEIAVIIRNQGYRCARAVYDQFKLPEGMRQFEMPAHYQLYRNELLERNKPEEGKPLSFFFHSNEIASHKMWDNLDLVLDIVKDKYKSITNTEYAEITYPQ